MRLLTMTAVYFVVCLEPSSAQDSRFPYPARVVDNEVFVRSGAGESWLPTQRLKSETIVTVHRHDPGGWYMIEPPAGSFSWIPAKFVKQLGGGEGEVTENHVVAFIGSDFGDDTTVWQRRLQLGEKVQILGQQEVQTLSGRQSMLKIAPPRREFRWIPGASVVPVDEKLRRQRDNDPYATPSNAVRNSQPSANTDGQQAGVSDVPPLNPDSQLARLRTIRTEQTRLAEIDARFREMVLQAPTAWNLDNVEQSYRTLQRESTYKPVAGQIDLRYPAIERYRRRLAEYLDFKRLTSETESRDAAIVARLNPAFGHPPAVKSMYSPPTIVAGSNIDWELPFPVGNDPAGNGITAAGVPGDSEAFALSAFPALTVSSSTTPDDSKEVSSGFELSVPDLKLPEQGLRSRYVGAGIIRRSEAGSDYEYVLTAPSGRVLAHLKPEASVSLQDYIGQAVGMHGSRFHDDRIGNDLIEVSGLEPVRIRE